MLLGVESLAGGTFRASLHNEYIATRWKGTVTSLWPTGGCTCKKMYFSFSLPLPLSTNCCRKNRWEEWAPTKHTLRKQRAAHWAGHCVCWWWSSWYASFEMNDWNDYQIVLKIHSDLNFLGLRWETGKSPLPIRNCIQENKVGTVTGKIEPLLICISTSWYFLMGYFSITKEAEN